MKIKVELDDLSENIRLDSFLTDYLEDYSRSKLQKLIKDKKVFVNDREQKPKYLVKDGDLIKFNLEDLKIKPIEAEDIDLEIIYQDDHIAIINKPVNLLSHPTATIRTGTLVNALKYHFNSLCDINGEDREGIVHRLDFNTSGLMIICLTNEAAVKISETFKNRDLVKKYRAIACGIFTHKEGDLEYPIARNIRNRKLMAVDDTGKSAHTSYKVLEEKNGFSYLDIKLHTGRTHQIRVHLSYINHPILGDGDYGGKRPKYKINHQLLQAYYLKFHHPISGEVMEFELPMSSEIKKYYQIIFEGD